MGLSNELSGEAGCFSRCFDPHRCFQSEALRLYFPAPEPWVVWSHSPIVPPGLSAHECGTAWSTSHRLAHLVYHLALCPLCPSCLFSPPPTSLVECFFFNSLVVRLPYSLIFCQFWLFIVFRFVIVLLLVVRGGTVCQPTPPSWPEVQPYSFS